MFRIPPWDQRDRLTVYELEAFCDRIDELNKQAKEANDALRKTSSKRGR